MNETELVGNEIMYLRPVKVSTTRKIVEGLVFTAVIIAALAILVALA